MERNMEKFLINYVEKKDFDGVTNQLVTDSVSIIGSFKIVEDYIKKTLLFATMEKTQIEINHAKYLFNSGSDNYELDFNDGALYKKLIISKIN